MYLEGTDVRKQMSNPSEQVINLSNKLMELLDGVDTETALKSIRYLDQLIIKESIVNHKNPT